MFEQIAVLNVSANNSSQLIEGITNPDILIEISNNETVQNGFLVQRLINSGKVFKIRWIQGGISGNLIAVPYGIQELLFDIPSPLNPFNLEIIPGRFQFKYSVKISIRVFNPIYSSLAGKLGIPLELLNRIPQQTLQILSGIDLMASADTRNLIQSIEATGAAIAADKNAQNAINASNAAAIVAVQSTASLTNSGIAAINTATAQISSEMIINESFQVSTTAFNLKPSGLYHAVLNLIKIDGSNGVQLSLTDNGGDEQGFSQLMVKYGENMQKVAIELTASQKTDSSFPLTLLCQGRKLTAVIPPNPPSPPLGATLENGFTARLLDRILTITNSSGTVTGASGSDIIGAYFRGGDRIYAQSDYGYFSVLYGASPEPTWALSSEADYQLAVSTGTAISN